MMAGATRQTGGSDGALPARPAPRPAPRRLHPDIDEALIRRLVEDFYGRVRQDEEIGPIFARIVADWPSHLDTMVDFWSAVTKVSSRFSGQPMRKHLAIPDLDARHFARWLVLFRVSAHQVAAPEVAAIFIDRAERIADSLQQGISFARRQSPGA